MKIARTSELQERLAKAAAYLEQFDEEHSSCADPTMKKALEKQIIWRELLDLELPEFDEEMERLSEAAQALIREDVVIEDTLSGDPYRSGVGLRPDWSTRSSAPQESAAEHNVQTGQPII